MMCEGSSFSLTSGGITIDGGDVNLAGLTVSSAGGVTFNSGSLLYVGDLKVGLGGLLGSDVTLASNRKATIVGTTTVDAFHTLTIAGGTGTGTLKLTFSNSGTITASAGQSGSAQFVYAPVVAGQPNYSQGVAYPVATGTSTTTIPIAFTFGVPLAFQIDFDVQAGEEGQVSRRPDVMNGEGAGGGPGLDHSPRGITRGDNRIIGGTRNTQPVELRRNFR